MEKVALIGGSGISDSPGFKDAEWKQFGTGILRGPNADGIVHYQEQPDGVIFIPRHGVSERRYGPAQTQYAANIVAAKMLGASVVIATSAVGSLRPPKLPCVDWGGIPLESLVVPDSFVDETGRDDNLFGFGLVVHANPRPAFSPDLRQILIEEAKQGRYFRKVVEQGTYICIPGDRFGTTAEGKKRAKYAHIVGMTACPEAALAIQAGLHYAVAAFPVDYDLDANHEGQTLQVMGRLSQPNRVPAYIEKVIERAKIFAADTPLLPQLKGNIIPTKDVRQIENENLRAIAQELMEKYCQ
jgi:5'-methylthioadenosine phosphorylase